jgi:MFS transporter, SHS family, sialic acid transporter
VICLMSFLSCGYLFRFLPAIFNLQFLVTAGVVGGITAAFYGWLPLYLPELFPTRVRATGQGLCFNIGRVLAALGTLFLGQLVTMYGDDWGKAMGTVTLVYLLGMVLIWFAPETKGKPLPE